MQRLLRKTFQLSVEGPACSLFQLGSSLVADYKKEFISYDLNRNMEVKYRREFPSQFGRVLGKHPQEYLRAKPSENVLFITGKNERQIQVWDLRDNKMAQSFKCGIEEVKGVEVVDGLIYLYGKSLSEGSAVNFYDWNFK
jgi:hypothetical protein